MLQFGHLQSFIAVAEEGSFVRAARRLLITQPALSRQIQNLEREVGTPLLERSGHAARLTAAGTVMLDFARRLLAGAEDAVIAARRAASGVTGRLVIGFISPATYTVLPALFRAFRERAPDVLLELRQLPSGPIAEALRKREIDIGFLHPPLESSPHFGARVVVDQPFVAALPANHPLAYESQISVTDLRDEPFVIFPRRTGPGLYDRIIHVCNEAGFTPRVVQEAEQLLTIAAIVGAGVGVALLPASVAKSWTQNVSYVGLRDTTITAPLAACWRLDSDNPAVGAFLQLLPAETQQRTPSGEPAGRERSGHEETRKPPKASTPRNRRPSRR